MRSGNSQILFWFQQIEELGKETQQNIEFFRNTFLGDRMGHGASVVQLDARPTDDQEVARSTPTGSATFFRRDFIMNYF